MDSLLFPVRFFERDIDVLNPPLLAPWAQEPALVFYFGRDSLAWVTWYWYIEEIGCWRRTGRQDAMTNQLEQVEFESHPDMPLLSRMSIISAMETWCWTWPKDHRRVQGSSCAKEKALTLFVERLGQHQQPPLGACREPSEKLRRRFNGLA
jgi:hypothetical protein